MIYEFTYSYTVVILFPVLSWLHEPFVFFFFFFEEVDPVYGALIFQFGIKHIHVLEEGSSGITHTYIYPYVIARIYPQETKKKGVGGIVPAHARTQERERECDERRVGVHTYKHTDTRGSALVRGGKTL